jgi:hypothetical protein
LDIDYLKGKIIITGWGEKMDKLKDLDKRIYYQLERFYPNKVVQGLNQENPSLYNEILKRIKDTNYKLEDYLQSIGFSYQRKQHKTKYTLETILEEVQKLYPSMKIEEGISVFQKSHSNLYYQLNKEAKKDSKTPTEFLTTHGFTVWARTSSKIDYDINALKKLKDEYICNFREISKLIGTSHQNLMAKLKVKKEYPSFWEQELTNEEIFLLGEMISNQKYLWEDSKSNIVIRIYKHHELTTSFAIFLINQKCKDIKCLFDIPQDLYNKLIEFEYDKLYEQDFELRNELINSSMITINKDGEKELRLKNSEKLNGKISSRINSVFSHLSKSEYIEFLGFKYIDARAKTDQEIINELKKYLIEGTNQVYIPSSDPNYHVINNNAHNRGYSLKDYIEHYGFEYNRTRVTNAQEKIIEKLNKHYIVEGNKVYISTYDPLYVNLNGYVLNRGKQNIKELLEEWGFERIYLENLPKDYKPYDWQKELEGKIYSSESDYQAMLNEIIIDENKVYLDSQSNLYNKLFMLAVKKGTTINELLSEWGYERIYGKNLVGDSEANTDKKRERLESIKRIQGDLSRSTTKEQKIQRSQKLAQEMKKLYDYRCQLCDYEVEGKFIPLIEKEDATNYMEVHHIIPVSQFDEVMDDTNSTLDTYENVIVVCAHHHRYLHYHDGGFEELFETENGELSFRSKNKKEIIRVFTNYHLNRHK